MTSHAGVEPIRVWTIYDHPSDYPDSFVVRPFSVGLVSAPCAVHAVADTLEEARATLPQGLIQIGLLPDDDPRIAETWI